MKIFLFSFLFLFSVNSLEKCNHEKPKEDDQTYSTLGERIDLPLNDSVSIKSENLKITFANMADSRCPTGVNCIQAGKAKVTLNLAKDEKEAEIGLEAKGLCEADDGSCGSTGSANGYTVKLINVYPYPSEPKNGDEQKSYARIVVTK